MFTQVCRSQIFERSWKNVLVMDTSDVAQYYIMFFVSLNASATLSPNDKFSQTSQVTREKNHVVLFVCFLMLIKPHTNLNCNKFNDNIY